MVLDHGTAPHATIRLAYHGLELHCPTAALSEDRPLSPTDYDFLRTCSTRHQQLARKSRSAADLLQLGSELFDC